MYLNKAIIIGNLTRKPEMKSLPSGVKVVNFSIATNRTWKDKDGSKQEAVEYHNLVAFGKQAELIEQYMDNGSQLFVEGRLQTRNWEKDEVKHYRTEIIVENFQFGNKISTDKPSEKGSSETEESATDKAYAALGKEEEINPEDIPF